MNKTVRWQAWEGMGLEHLVLEKTAHDILIESVIIGKHDEQFFGLNYQILCSPHWGIQKVNLRCIDTDEEIILSHNGKGEWYDDEQKHLPNLSGCYEVDISATPLTNSFPIHRLNLQPGETQDIKTIYFSVPSLEPKVVDQRYTCLDLKKLYRYDGLFRQFSAELEVDSDLLVKDYPDTFRRVE